MDITITDVTARAGVAFPAPPQRPAPATAPRAPAPRVAAVTKATETAAAATEPTEPTPPLPVAAERAALDRVPRQHPGEPEQAQAAYALTITDALWQLTKSFRTVV